MSTNSIEAQNRLASRVALHLAVATLCALAATAGAGTEAWAKHEGGDVPPRAAVQAGFLRDTAQAGMPPQQGPHGTDPVTGQATTAFLWDGFEQEPAAEGWSVDSANDPAELASDETLGTEGNRSMRVDARFKAIRRVLLRRAARLKLDGMASIIVDVHAASDDLRFSFAYKDEGGAWHESLPVALHAGWNLNVRCSAAELLSQPRRTASYWSARELREFYLIIHGGASDAAIVHIDNLRFAGQPAEDQKPAPSAQIELYQPTRSVGRWEKFEVGVQFQATQGDLFDPPVVRVEGAFTAPDTSTRVVQGFFAGYADSDRFGPSWPIFLIRFAPPQVGRWTFVVRVGGDTEGTSEARWFDVTYSASKGFVRVSKTDSRCFELDNGDFYYPIGQNIAWAQDYEPYFERQKETGQNWVRIWMCPWHLNLETKAGRYDLDAAERLDRIVDEAAARGLRIQLVLVHHGMVNGESWADNPYNWSNGGPCLLPSEFFSNPAARGLFKRRLDYLVARWGYSTAIFAWELFNEADLSYYATFGDVLDWHSEMSRYLNEHDPNQHLVTTSLSRDCPDTRLWEMPAIDFIAAHVYGPDAAQQALKLHLATQGFNKPVFIGEYGHGTSAIQAHEDRFGENLRATLWGTFMLPTAGNAMPWWWDSLIRPNNLERLFQPLSRFAKGIDRRSQHYLLIETAIVKKGGSEVAVRGLLSNQGCYLWLHAPAGDHNPNQAQSALIPPGLEFALDGMVGGRYAVNVIQTSTGRTLSRSVLTCEQGRLIVPLPPSQDDAAVKVEYLGSPRPRFYGSPARMRPEERPIPPALTQ